MWFCNQWKGNRNWAEGSGWHLVHSVTSWIPALGIKHPDALIYRHMQHYQRISVQVSWSWVMSCIWFESCLEQNFAGYLKCNFKWEDWVLDPEMNHLWHHVRPFSRAPENKYLTCHLYPHKDTMWSEKQANKKFLVPQVRPTLLKLSLEYSLHTLLDPVQHNMVNNQYTLCFVVVFTLIPTVTFYNVYSLDTPSAVMMGASTDHRCLMLSVLLTPRIWKDHRGGSFLFYQKVVHLIVPVLPAKNYTELGFPSFRRLDNPFLQQRAARSRHIHEPGTLEPLTHLLWLLGMWCLGRRWPELPRCLSHPPPCSTLKRENF